MSKVLLYNIEKENEHYVSSIYSKYDDYTPIGIKFDTPVEEIAKHCEGKHVLLMNYSLLIGEHSLKQLSLGTNSLIVHTLPQNLKHLGVFNSNAVSTPLVEHAWQQFGWILDDQESQTLLKTEEV